MVLLLLCFTEGFLHNEALERTLKAERVKVSGQQGYRHQTQDEWGTQYLTSLSESEAGDKRDQIELRATEEGTGRHRRKTNAMRRAPLTSLSPFFFLFWTERDSTSLSNWSTCMFNVSIVFCNNTERSQVESSHP